jgi:hypothetical protein
VQIRSRKLPVGSRKRAEAHYLFGLYQRVAEYPAYPE